MKKLIIFVFLLMYICELSAQIGINTDTPHQSAAFDIDTYNNDKGVLLPRLTTAQKQAITSPEPSLIVYDTDLKCISQYKDTPSSPGMYSWTCLTLFNRHFIYMPSINVPTSDGSGNVLTGTQSIGLYTIYSSRFGSPAKKNPAAPAAIPFFTTYQLHYYITYCDPCITVTGINDAGVLSYTVNNLPDYDAYMNIVFTIK